MNFENRIYKLKKKLLVRILTLILQNDYVQVGINFKNKVILYNINF